MTKPRTLYTKSGRINIAYQVIGNGSTDLVYVPGWVSNIDLMWRNPQLSDFLTNLSNHVRVILFDKRGTGLSDRVTELSTIEDRMDDIRAVMDAVGSKRAILFGHSEGGSVCALFAATYPQRTISLITFGVFAKRKYSKKYPWAPTEEERQKVYDMIETGWGSSSMDLASLAPSMADDQEFMEWLASYFRSGASPSAALVLTKMNTEVDIIDILETIEVPTLLLYRTDDIDVKIEEGKFIAERIKGAKFIEFPGSDHLFWVGDATAVRNEMIRFISGNLEHPAYDRILATILKIKIDGLSNKQAVSSSGDQLKNKVKEMLEEIITQFRGKIIDWSSDLSTATFDGPSKAVHSAIAIRDTIQQWNLIISQGIHIGECIISPIGELRGSAIEITEEVLTSANNGEIIITSTVNNLLSGAGLEFKYQDDLQTSDRKSIRTLSLNETYTRKDRNEEIAANNFTPSPSVFNHSFLENVLQSIENHLADEQYSIKTLCRDVNVSERQLQRKLKSITNKSPNQLVRSVRLHRAKEMILMQKNTISEVAFSTGFSSVSYFTKCFKKEFGHIPSDLFSDSW